MKPSLLAIAILLLLSLLSSGQSRWMRTYRYGLDNWLADMVPCYDGGYLLSGGDRTTSWYKYSWLIKTDINGEVIWEKIIGDGITSIYFESIDQNSLGETFIAAITEEYGNYDPIIIKLNSCGEKEWCRVMNSNSGYDYTYDICALNDGGCTVLYKYMEDPPGDQRLCLFNLASDGQLKWKECNIPENDSISLDEQYELIMTNDDGYLITGSCHMDELNPPYWPRMHAYIIKADSMGMIEWERVVERDSSWNRGEGFNTVISPDGQFYYTSEQHEQPYYDYKRSPALVKIDLNGNVIGIYDIAPPARYGTLYGSIFVNDSTLAGIAHWGEELTNIKAVLFKVEGIIQNDASFLYYSVDNRINLSNDGKILIYSEFYDESDLNEICLYKFNSQMIDDTLYLQPFRYDTLCSHPIISDTVFINDCDLIVKINEKPQGEQSSRDIVRAWPNPCEDVLTFSFNSCIQPKQVNLYNVYGQLLLSRVIRIDERLVSIKTGEFPAGIIIALIQTADQKTYTRKIVKL
jgi:hypothetical protein